MRKSPVFLTAILFLLALIGFEPAHATHYMGVTISYECTGTCTYRIFHDTYYDCSGAATVTLPGPPIPPTVNIDGPGGQPCTEPTAQGPWQFVHYVEITPICPGVATQCSNPNGVLNGVLEARFYRDYDFCSVNCSTYTVSWSNCCRNFAITSGAGNTGIASNVTLIDLGASPCNSSPQFTSSPTPYICTGQTYVYTQGAYDPDGDSLSFYLGPCLSTVTGTQVTYNPGYSPIQPLGPAWNVSLDPVNGDVTIIPNPGSIEVGVLCIYVAEYRNGVLIGQVLRDIQITTIPCNGAANPPSIDSVVNIVNATQGEPQ